MNLPRHIKRHGFACLKHVVNHLDLVWCPAVVMKILNNIVYYLPCEFLCSHLHMFEPPVIDDVFNCRPTTMHSLILASVILGNIVLKYGNPSLSALCVVFDVSLVHCGILVSLT